MELKLNVPKGTTSELYASKLASGFTYKGVHYFHVTAVVENENTVRVTNCVPY